MPYGHIEQYLDLVEKAQRTRLQITKAQRKEIANLYADLAAKLQKELSKYSKETLTYRFLKDYAKSLKLESGKLYSGIKEIISSNMLSTATAVVTAQSKFFGSIVPELSKRFTDVFSSVPQSAVNELISGKIYKDFRGLSERIWNYKGEFNRDIQSVINSGIIAQKSAFDIAKDLECYLNPNAMKPFDWSRVYPNIHKKVDYNAQRLARTSVTHAYQLAFQRSTKDNPFVEKYIWRASNGGRVCELCLSRDGHEFDKNDIALDHPNGMCVLVPKVSKSYDEIADELADFASGKENESLDKWLNSDGNGGIIKTVSVSGALNPYSKKADEHAERYYGLVRSMRTDVNHIANNTGMDKNEIQNIKRYLFMDMHDLGESGIKRFDPDYMIAESWQRLVAGKEIKPHDLILLKHELEERELILKGLSQRSAHIEATKKYNYQKEASEFYGND